MKQSIDKTSWEELATDHSMCRSYLQATLKVGEENILTALENKHRVKKEKLNNVNLLVVNTLTNDLDR